MEMGHSMNLNGGKDYYLTGHKFPLRLTAQKERREKLWNVYGY